MLLKLATLNINGFNRSSTHLPRIIFLNNFHFFFIQETHTIQKQELSHFCHLNNFLVYSNTDHLLTPHIAHRQGSLILINTQQIHLTPRMIKSHIILHNYIESHFIHPS